MSELPQEVLNARVSFGLKPGHVETIETMLAEGAGWGAIGKAIGWHGPTAKEYFERHKAPMGQMLAKFGDLKRRVWRVPDVTGLTDTCAKAEAALRTLAAEVTRLREQVRMAVAAHDASVTELAAMDRTRDRERAQAQRDYDGARRDALLEAAASLVELGHDGYHLAAEHLLALAGDR